MGGRGGSSGNSGIAARLPGKLSYDPQSYEFPALEGTEKQVKWAEKIRMDALERIWNYATTYTSDGRPSGMAEIYLCGKAAMLSDIKNNQLIQATSGSLREEKLRDAINSFAEAKARMDRWNVLTKKRAQNGGLTTDPIRLQIT